MKTLLQINTVVNSGSTGRIAEEIGQIAMANGWQSYIAFGRNERPSKSQLIRIGSDLEIKMHGLKTRIFDLHGFGSIKATKRFVEKIIEIKPDIIHLHNIHGYYLNIEILFNFLANAKIPVIWTMHDCWPITGHCTHFEFIGCEKWKTQCYSCPQLKEYPASLLSDNSKQNYLQKKKLFTSVNNLKIIPVSDWLQNILHQSFLAPFVGPVIKNGIDTDTFKIKNANVIRLKHGLENSFLILGVANVWNNRKGLQDFFELSKILPEDCRILLVGLSKTQIKNIPENIIGIEKTENTDELASYYSMADIFINPTYEDNFPSTNLEALACGTPVLTYKTGGSVEAITQETGFVTEQGDINAIMTVISKLRNNRNFFKSKNCRNLAVNQYNKEISFLKYFKLYEQITEGI